MISVEFEGDFKTREDAAEALREAASDVEMGRFSAMVKRSDNPKVFVTGEEE